MNANPWSLPKDRALRRLLLSLNAQAGDHCDIAIDNDGGDPRVLTLRHPELTALRAHVYLHGQRPGTYGLFFEYPHPVPGMLETEENLSLPAAVASLTMHFEA